MNSFLGALLRPISLALGLVLLIAWVIAVFLLWRAALVLFPELLQFDRKSRSQAYFRALGNSRTALITFALIPAAIWLPLFLPERIPHFLTFLDATSQIELNKAISLCIAFLLVFVAPPLLSRSAIRESLRKELARRHPVSPKEDG